MSYAEDLRTLAKLEKLRMAALIAAFTCTLVTLVVEHMGWLAWPRAFAWALGGVFAALEARCEKRLGRDPDGSWLRAVLLLVVAATNVAWALRG